MSEFIYGDSVEDLVTGYTGTITGHAYYWNYRNDAYLVEGIDSTGRPCGEWVDANRLRLIKRKPSDDQ